jgi:eukaryotic-like serine/threonine-protein kinase
MRELATGTRVLKNRYELVKALGQGGMGVVWHAVDVRTHRSHAIKFIRTESDLTARARFLREVEAMNAIAHPNVVAIHEIAVDDDGTPAIVMELLHGESLGARLEREGYLSAGQACAILLRVSAAIEAAHAAGIVHRDLKPDNIFITGDPEGEADVRVLDFGIAKRFSNLQDKLTETGTVVGTPFYMSPEQAAGEKNLDSQTDVWALSVIAFECLTGRLPVAGDNYGQLLARLIRGEITKLEEVRPDLPPMLIAGVDVGLVDRTRRPGLAPLTAALRAHADAAIVRPPTRMEPVSSPKLMMEAAPTETIPTVVTADAVAPRSSSRRVVFAALVGVLAAGALAGTVRLVYPHRSNAAMPPPSEPASSSAAITASSAPVSVAEPVSTLPSPSTTAAEPPKPPSSASVRTTPARTAAPALTPSPRPSATPVSSSSSGPARLQGGVAPNVPF